MRSRQAAIGQTGPGDLVVDVPFMLSANGEKFPVGHFVVGPQTAMSRIFGTAIIRDFTCLLIRDCACGPIAIWITGRKRGKESRTRIEGEGVEMEMAVVRPAQQKPLLRRGGFRQE